MSNILNNTTSLQEVLEALQNKAAGEQATPVISVNTSGLITATAGAKSSTYQLAFQAAKTITPNTTNQIAVSSGYYTGGNITVKGDSNLVASNIKSGVSIFGVNGTYEGSGSGGEVDYSVEDAIITRTISGTYANDRINYIGDYTFQSCTKLTSINFPACTNIGNNAFYGCVSLTSINFPICITIGSGVFYRCSLLTSVDFPACTYIGSQTFNNCFSLTSISFPVCTSIGSNAFYNCSSLTSISFPACISIGSYAFQNCFSLTSISFPVCTSIGSYAFNNCSSLTSISFPVCTSIGSYAFRNCYSLTSISFPVCTSIRSYAFYNCSSLTSISFPACISIGSYAFQSCSSLISAHFGSDIPSTSTTIRAFIYPSAFYSCSKLTNLTLYYPSVATLSNINAFTSTPMSVSTLTGSFGSIYVPASLVDTYKSATNWVTYSARITAIEGDSGGDTEGGEGVTLITFTIIDVKGNEIGVYSAEKDMTWEQWIESNYNVDGYYINSQGFITRPDYPSYVLQGVAGSDIILDGRTYDFSK